jgi:hypothetical protein
VVDKKSMPTKSYVIEMDGKEPYFFDEKNNLIEFDLFFKLFPKIETLFLKISEPKNIYSYLKLISEGYEYNSSELNDIDPLITKIKYNKNNYGKSVIILQFDDYDEYFKLFDLSNDDIWFLRLLFHGKRDLGFYYSDFAYADWKEGSLLFELSDENKQKIIEISSYFLPNIKTIDDSTSEKISIFLYNTFRRKVENIVDDYQYNRELCMSESSKKSIGKELSDPFSLYGIIQQYQFYKYLTSVKVLLSLFKLYGKKDDTLTELLTRIGSEKNFGPYYEQLYEYDCLEFDSKGYNDYVSGQLDDILEEIENDERFSNLEEFKKINSFLSSKYEFEKWYVAPKDKGVFFSIINIDPTTNKINVNIQKSRTSPQERRSLTLDEFNSFLHNLELFETKSLKFKKKV